MYAIFKINPIVLESTCVFHDAHPTYLFYTSQPSNNPHSSKHLSCESNFSFLNEWKLTLPKSKSFSLHIRKNVFHENANTFGTGPTKIFFSLKVNTFQKWEAGGPKGPQWNVSFRWFGICRSSHRRCSLKIPVPESLFNRVAGLSLKFH